MSGLERMSIRASEPSSFPLKSLEAYSEFLAKCRRDFDETWEHQRFPVGSLSDWDRLKTLGSGSFGRVMLVKNKTSGQFCVMKIIEKSKIVKQQQTKHLRDERKVLNFVKFPFLLSLISCFKNFNYVFFIMPFIGGGEMFYYLKRVGKFNEDQSRFYAAQVALSFEYLHNIDVIYRDLKPENILFDEMGYLKIADMGFCKVVKSRTWSMCGTPDYLAPEIIILNKGYGKSVDWWALGVLVYEMTAGFPPFYGGDEHSTHNNISSGKYREVSHFSSGLRNLIANLLQVDLTRRYGNLKNGVNDIKKHPWFKSIDWLAVLNKQVKAPYIPVIAGPGDTRNFDRHVEEELKEVSCERFPDEFKDF